MFQQWTTPQWKQYRRVWRSQNKDKVALQNKRASKTQRSWRFRTEYKINLEFYEEMFKAQEGLCAICRKAQSNFKYRFAVDHDHKTGQVRVEDSLFMLKAKEYLGGNSSAV
jgi:hypothetical protein